MVLTHQNLKNAQYEARTIRITESNGTAGSSIEAMMCATMIYDDHQAEYAGRRPEPRHYHDIAKRPDAVRWYAACDDEIKKLFDMGAFDIVDTPKDKKIMEGVFSFKTKYDSEGKVLKYAARGNVNGSKAQSGIESKSSFDFVSECCGATWPRHTILSGSNGVPSLGCEHGIPASHGCPPNS